MRRDFVSAAATVLSLAGLSLFVPTATFAAERDVKKSETPSDKLSSEDCRSAAPVISQIMKHLEAASRHLSEDKTDEARTDAAKAERLFGVVRDLLIEEPSEGQEKEQRTPLFRRRDSDDRKAKTQPHGPGSRHFSPFWDNDWLWDDDFSAHDPFAEVRSLHERVRRMFDDSVNRMGRLPAFSNSWDSAVFAPEMDLTEEGGKYVVRLDIPGTDKDSIKVTVQDRQLSVSGSSNKYVEEKKEGRTLRRERQAGHFQRSITLPGPVESEKMEARYDNGVLTITAPKAKAGSERKTVTVY